MTKPQIKLYYKNVTAEILGPKDGITTKQLQALAGKTNPLIKKLNKERSQGLIPYRDLPFNTKTCQEIKNLTKELRERFETLVVLGIGGSALGNIALQTALNPYMYNTDDSQRKGPRIFIFDNIDPEQLASFLRWADGRLDKILFNVISKSGKTTETAAQFMIMRQILLEKIGPSALKTHVIATTDAKHGTLRKIADDEGIPSLTVPEGVPGRFSALSAVGLFSAHFCGINIDLLLEGARDMDERVSREDFYRNPAAINAAINYHFYNHGKSISVIMPYSFALGDLADWYCQLWAESLGKEKDLNNNVVHIGPTPVKAIGTTDQHSQVQLYCEGPNNKLFTFLEVNNFDQDLTIGPAPEDTDELNYLSGSRVSKLLNNEKIATEYVLLANKRPCLSIVFDHIDPYTVGQFIYLYEVTTSFAAELFGINAYDQPAVELGKNATMALMGDGNFAQLSKQIKPLTQIDGDFIV